MEQVTTQLSIMLCGVLREAFFMRVCDIDFGSPEVFFLHISSFLAMFQMVNITPGLCSLAQFGSLRSRFLSPLTTGVLGPLLACISIDWPSLHAFQPRFWPSYLGFSTLTQSPSLILKLVCVSLSPLCVPVPDLSFALVTHYITHPLGTDTFQSETT